jgi:hypothetical protein
MFKIAAVVWIMVGTVFAGIAVMTVLTVPALSGHAMQYIPVGAVGGFIVAIPVAFLVARRMSRTATG